MSTPQHSVFTIGHSNHPPKAFLDLLREHCVDAVADVRSSPYSRYNPHFNHTTLNALLDEAAIDYVFLGQELGGRPLDRSCYDENGRVQYERLANTDLFDDGIRRILWAANERRLALMCSEKEPLNCHRALLIAKVLEERSVDVQHILADGSIEKHGDTMNRLMDGFKLPRNGDLFRSRSDVIAEALNRRTKKLAFIDEKMSTTNWSH